MAEQTPEAADGAIRLKCVCDGDIDLDPDLLGRVLRCPHCGRYFRAALQFLLADRALAHNITVVCTCGRFIIQPIDMAGKRAACVACGRRVILPTPVEREGGQRLVLVPRMVLEKQLKRVQRKRRRPAGKGSRLPSQQERVTLKLSKKPCVNSECGAPLPEGANVCGLCGTNALTGIAYTGIGPEKDPRGKWKMV